MTAQTLSRRIDRRSLIKGGAAGVAGLALLKATGGLGAGSAHAAPAATAGVAPGPLAWVWRFGEDGSPAQIRDLLAAHGVGVLLKVFDGVNWMSKYDKGSPMPMSGPDSVRQAAAYFESAGVPFHAWCVVNGEDPIREAQLASMVLDAGARTLTFDLELPEGTNYWQAGPAEAQILGAELRRLQPSAYLTVAPDARPWQVEQLPMAEFAAFCNDIAPQTYWRTFDTPANHRLLAKHGFPIGPEGLTPELIIDATYASLRQHNRPVRPVGQGAADRAGWERFTAHAASLGMQNLSTWRVGTTLGDVWPVLSLTDTTRQVVASPQPEPEPVVAAVEQSPAAPPIPAAEPAAPPVAGNDLKSETASARTTNETSSARSEGESSPGASVSKNVRTEWHERLNSVIKSARPFGIGGK